MIVFTWNSLYYENITSLYQTALHELYHYYQDVKLNELNNIEKIMPEKKKRLELEADAFVRLHFNDCMPFVKSLLKAYDEYSKCIVSRHPDEQYQTHPTIRCRAAQLGVILP